MRANLITGPRYLIQRNIDRENRLEKDKKIDRFLYGGRTEDTGMPRPDYHLVRQKSGRQSIPNYPVYISHINSHKMIQIERQKTRIQKRIDEIEKSKNCSTWPNPKMSQEPLKRSTPIEPEVLTRNSREYEKPWQFRRCDQYRSVRLERRYQFRPSGLI